MQPTNTAKINTAKLTSFEAVLNELRKLDRQLDRAGYKQFSVFNKAYYVVTDTIKNVAENNQFDHPQFIEKFSIYFASYYFQAVNDTIIQNPNLPSAWAKLNSTRRTNLGMPVPAFIQLLMGANAHIQHDFPLALVKLMNSENITDLLPDVLKVDKLLMKSGKQIITTFSEPNHILDFLKRHLQFLYYRPTMYIILYWRFKAWHTYLSISKAGLPSDYQQQGGVAANRLCKLGNCLSKLRTHT